MESWLEQAKAWVDVAKGWIERQIADIDINEIIAGFGAKVSGEALGTFLWLLFVTVGGLGLLAYVWSLIRAWRIRKGKHEHYTILVARLERDPSNSQQRHIVHSLAKQLGGAASGLIKIQAYPRAIPRREDMPLDDAMVAAVKTGRGWLAAKKADVLVWGEVVREDTFLRLHLVTPEGQADQNTKGYELAGFELQKDFGEDFGSVLAGLVASNIAPAYEGGRYLGDILQPALVRLRALAKNLPSGLSVDARGRILLEYGIAAWRLGEQSGAADLLEEAVKAYRAVLEVLTRERVPLNWATTQNNLGNALQALGAREEGTARLTEAVAAYRAALEVYTREQAPLDWAMTQNNLGNALATLGAREEGTARLLDAVKAYRAALEVYTRERVQLNWAGTQNNLGNALKALGEREEGTTRLMEAVQAYRAALEVYTREQEPLDWAMTQNNLGNALRALGQREEGTARLLDAVKAYRAALEVRTRERVPLNWAMTQNNLGTALRGLGAREEGTARLNEAVAACRAALEVHTRERVPLDWAVTQNNLGAALETLGEREEGTARLLDAVKAYRAALEVFTPEVHAHYHHVVTQNLARVEALIAQRQGLAK